MNRRIIGRATALTLAATLTTAVSACSEPGKPMPTEGSATAAQSEASPQKSKRPPSGTVLFQVTGNSFEWAGGDFVLLHDPGGPSTGDILENYTTGHTPSWYPEDSTVFAKEPEYMTGGGHLFAKGPKAKSDLQAGQTILAMIDPKTGEAIWERKASEDDGSMPFYGAANDIYNPWYAEHTIGDAQESEDGSGTRTVTIYDAKTGKPGQVIHLSDEQDILSYKPVIVRTKNQVQYLDSDGKVLDSLPISPNSDKEDIRPVPDGILTTTRLGEYTPPPSGGLALVDKSGDVKWSVKTDGHMLATTAHRVLVEVESTGMLVILDTANGHQVGTIHKKESAAYHDCDYITRLPGDRVVADCEETTLNGPDTQIVFQL